MSETSESQLTQVTVAERWGGRALPALVTAGADNADLAAWVDSSRDAVTSLAHRIGAILMRGFAVAGPAEFRVVMDALSPNVLDYSERSSPRTEISPGIYTSTEYPADQPILLHNEQSYASSWPTRIVFCCEQPPSSGGRTPLADSRRILGRLTSETITKFERLGIRYVRNYLPGISLSWQETFQTQRCEDVEAYCQQADITAEWINDRQLRTYQIRSAVRAHPVTGERSWFNHALFFHVTSLPAEVRDGLLELLPEEDLPYNTYYGDGSPIEAETLAEIRSAYAAETTSFEWEPGDVLLVENMLTAHGREPFEGPRRILAAMSDPVG